MAIDSQHISGNHFAMVPVGWSVQEGYGLQLNLSVMAMIIFLGPMFYLLLAFPAFLFVRLDIPPVAYIFRSVFVGFFLILLAVGLVATLLSASTGRLAPTLCFAGFTALDFFWRRWTLRRVDFLVAELQSGGTGVGPRLRQMHLTGMAINAIQLASVLPFIPALVSTV